MSEEAQEALQSGELRPDEQAVLRMLETRLNRTLADQLNESLAAKRRTA